MDVIGNLLLLPFRLLWNIVVTALIIGGFILWFGFIFGSVIAVILILIFAPELFLLPLVMVGMYVSLWTEPTQSTQHTTTKTIQDSKELLIEDDNTDGDVLVTFGFIGGLFLVIFIGSWIYHFITN